MRGLSGWIQILRRISTSEWTDESNPPQLDRRIEPGNSREWVGSEEVLDLWDCGGLVFYWPYNTCPSLRDFYDDGYEQVMGELNGFESI